MSKALVLQTELSEMIGFLLFASDKTVFCELGWEGHCIFTGVPKESAVFENTLCEYLQGNKNIEFNAKIISTENGYELLINRLLTAKLSTDLNVVWSPLNSELKGHCFVPIEKAS